MKIIRPIEVLDAVLTSSGVPEVPPSAWSNVTTYAQGDRASVASGIARDVYVSRWSGNLNNAPASSPDWWRLEGTTYPAYAGGTTYAQGDRVVVVGAESHRAYESVQAANTGHAVTDAAWWLDLGPTNRWAMFDASVTTQTSNPDEIAVVLHSPSRVDSVALQNVSAAQARVVMTDATDGVVHDQTYPLISDSGINTWWAWFNEPIVRLRDLTVIGLPAYGDVDLAITLSDAGVPVLCGACVVGLSAQLGNTQWAPTVGIQDYSVKQADDFGNYTVVKRAFAKRATFSVWVEPAMVDQLQLLLADYRATPIVWVGDEAYASTVILGFYKDFSIEISYPTVSLCSLEIEGI